MPRAFAKAIVNSQTVTSMAYILQQRDGVILRPTRPLSTRSLGAGLSATHHLACLSLALMDSYFPVTRLDT
jgi:hypothetical protein